DPVKDLQPVGSLARGVFFLAVHPSLPVNSVAELVALAKTKPGALAVRNVEKNGPGANGAYLSPSVLKAPLALSLSKGNAGASTAHDVPRTDSPAFTLRQAQGERSIA
ncbi:MAG: hypothetical protein ACKVQT_32920, partial [Burkholderiales bacterium]